MFDLVVKSNKEKGANFAKFDSTACFNLKAPVLVIFCDDWTASVTDDEDGRKVGSDKTPEENVESEGDLPANTEYDGKSQPQKEMNENE